ncbi:Dual specificity testis-specific protein kinase 2, partial [Anas platyrhynchos]
RFMGVCVHQGQLHALTEYINGGNLEQLLDSPVPLSWSTRIQLALDIARGLHYLHSKGIFHRDLTSKVGAGPLPSPPCSSRHPQGAEEVGTQCRSAGRAHRSRGMSPWAAGPPMTPLSLQADVFAYGIILCETIARVPADPDYLPRTEDFGLNVTAFHTMVGLDCPAAFLQMAFHCCSMEPTSRPSFLEITQCLEGILQHQLGTEGVARRPASHAKQLLLHELGKQHLQLDQHLSCSQSDIFPSKLPTLLQLPEPCGRARTKETLLRINPFSQREDLKGGKIKLFDMPSKSVISFTFDLPPPASLQLCSPMTPEPAIEVQCDFLVPAAAPHKCHSLPTSPELPCHGGLALGVESPAQPPSSKWSREDAGELGSGIHASPPGPTAGEQMDCSPHSPKLL